MCWLPLALLNDNCCLHYFTPCSFSFGRIGEGAVDWNAVSAALCDVGYDGWVTYTEFSLALPTRILNKVCAVLSAIM